MKKILCILVVFSLLFTFAGCKGENENSGIKVVASCFPAYDFARSILGEDANITLLLPPGGEAHDFEPTPTDIIKIKNCDLFIFVGGHDEEWVNTLLKDGLKETAKAIKLVDLFEKSGDDEHFWTSPKNALTITEKIYEAVVLLDENNRDKYQKNFNTAKDNLNNLDTFFKDITKNSLTVVFADRFPFHYLAKEYGIEYVSPFKGCSAHTEPDAKAVANTITFVKENNLPYIFYTEFSNQKMADTVCEETGAKKLLFHSCHNVTKEEFTRGETYYSLMQKNAENLKLLTK